MFSTYLLAACSVTAATVLATAPIQTATTGRASPTPQARGTIPAQPMQQPVRLTATGTFSDGTSRVFLVTADRDSDNDGVPDAYELRVTCSGGAVSSSVVSPRDASSGLANGKRMHSPAVRGTTGHVEGVDDWTTRTVGKQIAASWDLATMKGARSSTATPSPVALVQVDPAVCAP